ncbi:hypothetical protein METHP14_10043 [Pseudomonas sp. P14-2025]
MTAGSRAAVGTVTAGIVRPIVVSAAITRTHAIAGCSRASRSALAVHLSIVVRLHAWGGLMVQVCGGRS